MQRRLVYILLLALPLSTIFTCLADLSVQSVWNFRSAPADSGWTNLIFDTSDLSEITANAQAGAYALYPFTWTAPRPGHEHTPCVSPIPRFRYTNCLALRSDYKQAWAETFQLLQPFIANRTVIGVFLGDEQLWNGASMSELGIVADMIRADWPEAILYSNEAQDTIVCNFNRMNETTFQPGQCLPENLDWFGFDFYASDNASWLVQQESARNQLYPRMSVSQRLLPTTVGFFAGVTPQQLPMLDEFCGFNAYKFSDWAAGDERVVGVFPFTWTFDGVSTDWITLNDMPVCRDAWRDIGSRVVRQHPVPIVSVNNVPQQAGGVQRTCTPVGPVPSYPWCDTHH